MYKGRGILVLTDPVSRKNSFSGADIWGETLIFEGGGRFFPQARAALQAARMRHEWICVAACGSASAIALALAAQLPVDRIAIWTEPHVRAQCREIRRIEAFARRNLALVASEILMIDAREGDVRRMVRGLGRLAAVKNVQSAGLSAGDLTGEWR